MTYPLVPQSNVVVDFNITKKSDTEIELTDNRGRATVRVKIPGLTRQRQEPSPYTATLTGAVMNTTYYVYAKLPATSASIMRRNSGFDVIFSTDGSLIDKHRLLGTAITDGTGAISEVETVGLPGRVAELEADIIEDYRVDLWIDGTNGDDGNLGTSLDDAVKTIPRLKELIPEWIKSNFFVINMRGNVDLTPANTVDDGGQNLNDVLQFNTIPTTTANAGGKTAPVIIVDGGPDRTEILGTTTSDGSAVGEVSSGAAWTPNAYRGLFCRFTSGPVAGRSFPIKYNTASTLYLACGNDSGVVYDPGVGSDFVIERPETTLTGGIWFFNRRQDYIFGASMNGGGDLYVQNLYLTSATLRISSADAGKSYSQSHAAQLVLDPKGSGSFLGADCVYGFIIGSSNRMIFDADMWDTAPDTPVFTEGGDPGAEIGVACTSEPYIAGVFIYSELGCGAYYSSLCKTAAWYCTGFFRMNDSYATRLTVLNSPNQGHGGRDSQNLNNVELGGNVVSALTDLPALEISYSDFDMKDVKLDYALHGMRMINSKVVMANVSGSNNVYSGVWADSKSVILQPSNRPVNTVSGNGGAVEISEDGVTQVSTWLALKQLAATGSITAVAPGSLVNNTDTFTVDDGTNPAITFEFHVTDPFVPTGGAVEVVDVTGDATADDVADSIEDAIDNSVGALDISADASGAVVSLENVAGNGAAGNVAITETVADAGFLVSGMSGGQTATPVSDPELSAKEGWDIYTANWGGPHY